MTDLEARQVAMFRDMDAALATLRARHFLPGVRMTLIARMPDVGESGVAISSDDDPVAAAAALLNSKPRPT